MINWEFFIESKKIVVLFSNNKIDKIPFLSILITVDSYWVTLSGLSHFRNINLGTLRYGSDNLIYRVSEIWIWYTGCLKYGYDIYGVWNKDLTYWVSEMGIGKGKGKGNTSNWRLGHRGTRMFSLCQVSSFGCSFDFTNSVLEGNNCLPVLLVCCKHEHHISLIRSNIDCQYLKFSNSSQTSLNVKACQKLNFALHEVNNYAKDHAKQPTRITLQTSCAKLSSASSPPGRLFFSCLPVNRDKVNQISCGSL